MIIIILLIYIFYKSYSNIYVQKTNELSRNNDLLNSINKNSKKIEKMESLLNENNFKLGNIMKSLEASSENETLNLALNEIQSEFNNIKIELKKINNNFEENVTSIDQKKENNTNYTNRQNTIQLIKYIN